MQQQVPLYNVFPSPGLTITTQPGPELASPPPTLPSLLSSLDTTTTMSQVRPSAGDQVAMSHVVSQIDESVKLYNHGEGPYYRTFSWLSANSLRIYANQPFSVIVKTDGSFAALLFALCRLLAP